MSSSSKFARGAGRGHFAPPQKRGIISLRQPHLVKDRVTMMHSKDMAGSASAGNGSNATSPQEESYQLLASPTSMQPFAMMIRLTPELLEELKQAETEGNTPRMKFAASGIGHVIQVGQENFNISSAPEPGDLCDIYEQRSDENGQLSLVEAGSAWRKLSVLRTLSASEKVRVKQRTAEAELKQKQRKSILVDPSTQMIIPQAVSADANGRKQILKQKREPPLKKRRFGSNSVAPPSKPRPQPQPIAAPSMGNHRVRSPPPTSPTLEPPTSSSRGTPLTSQVGGMHPPKGRPPEVEGMFGVPANKGAPVQREKVHSSSSAEGASSAKMESAVNMTDLRNFLIALLQDNPKGVTIKMVEKAIIDGMPVNPGRKIIEKMIRSGQIATYQSPGKYLLNPGVEKGHYVGVMPASSGKVLEGPDSGQKQEEHFCAMNGEEKETDEFLSNIDVHEVVFEHTSTQYSSDKDTSAQPMEPEPLDAKGHHGASPKQSGVVDAKKTNSDHSESSSSSGSESESGSGSDSSGSGSGSDSGSASGSGTDSDASSSSSDTSADEDVDIMSDDENEKGKGKTKEGKLASKDNSQTEEVLNKGENKSRLPLHSLEQAATAEHDIMDQQPLERHENLNNEVLGPDEDADTDASIEEDMPEPLANHSELPDLPARHNRHGPGGSPLPKEKLRADHQLEDSKLALRNADHRQDVIGKPSAEHSSKTNEANATSIRKGSAVFQSIHSEKDEHMRHKKEDGSRSPSKSGGVPKSSRLLITSRDGARHFTDGSRKDAKPKATSDGLPPKSLSNVEVSKLPESILKVGREDGGAKQPPVRQQTSTDSRRSVEGRDKYVKGLEKTDLEKASETVLRVKSPGHLPIITSKSREGSVTHEEGGVAADVPDQSFKGARVEQATMSGKEDDPRGKESFRERCISKSTKAGRQNMDIDAKERQPVEPLYQTTGTVLHSSIKELGLSSGYEREAHRPSKESSYVQRPTKQTSECRNPEIFERAGLMVEQAERPLKEPGPTRRGKDLDRKDVSREADLMGRPIINGIESAAVTNAGRASYSGSIYSKTCAQESNMGSHDLELGELLEPASSKSQAFDGRKLQARVEESKARQAFDGDGLKNLQKESSSPDDVELFQPLHKTRPDTTKQSPYKVGDGREDHKAKQALDARSFLNASLSPDTEQVQGLGKSISKRSPSKFGRDPGHKVQDPRGGKRRLEECHNSESERPSKKKAEAVLVKQPLQSKQESFREDGREKARLITLEGQESEVGPSSKTGSLENSKRKSSNKELVDNKPNTINKQNASSTPATLQEKYRDTVKADNFQQSAKKQTPQSCEVQGIDFFAPFEKEEPYLRGPIESYEQYKEYVKEYNEKHPVYLQINKALESDKEEFEFLRKQIEEAKRKEDKSKLGSVFRRVKQEYSRSHKRFRRMQHTFGILHEELQAIKHRCKEYAEKVGQG